MEVSSSESSPDNQTKHNNQTKHERHLSKSYDSDNLHGRKRSNAISISHEIECKEGPGNLTVPREIIDRNQVRRSVILTHALPFNASVSFHRFALELTHATSFKRIMLFIILFNAVAIALQMEVPDRDYQNVKTFVILNDIFLACYTLEFVLKFYADRYRYWLSSYNLFDFTILLVAYVDITLDLVSAQYDDRFLDMMRSLRSFRALKIVNFLPGVQVIASALGATLKQLIRDVILLLLLLMFVFGIMGFYFFGYEATSDVIVEQWGSISSTFLTLFTVVTADRWARFIEQLVEYGGNSVLMSRAYIIAFLFVGHFIMSNLFIAVIITNIEQSSNEFKHKLASEKDVLVQERKKTYWMRSRREVKRMVKNANMDGSSNFQELAAEFYLSLPKRDFIVMSDLKTNVLWMDTVLKELARNVRCYKRSQYLRRDMVSNLAPVCNYSVADPRKASISQHKRYVINHKIGGYQLIKPGTNLAGHRISFLQR